MAAVGTMIGIVGRNLTDVAAEATVTGRGAKGRTAEVLAGIGAGAQNDVADVVTSMTGMSAGRGTSGADLVLIRRMLLVLVQ
mmetsp:Transcript_35580/g.75984  ORF Transcript_35580/g.75984 Transcript_35580/m.75984 type:complete len:82 (+) Transcript_35580:175-420(+)